MSVLADFKSRVEEFLGRTGIPPSRFGDLACNDGNFVSDLRSTRKPGSAMIDKVDLFMSDCDRTRGEAFGLAQYYAHQAAAPDTARDAA